MSNYDAVFEYSRKKFVTMDIDEICRNTRSKVSEDRNYIIISYYCKPLLIDTKDGQVYDALTNKEADISTKMIVMHHLVGAKGGELTGKLVPYRDVENASPFYPAFVRWAIDPLRKSFSGKLDAFIRAGKLIGATEQPYGHAAFTLNAFPMIPVTCIFWDGDDEVPANANILFDSSIRNFIHEEDVSVIGRDASELLIIAAGVK